MADSFFGFSTSLTELELDDAPDLDEEEEYDALNHETFGENAFQGDWEEDHTRFAEVTENSRIYKNSFNSEKDDDDLDFETSISQLVLEDGEEEDYDDLNCTSHSKTSESINITDNLQLERNCDFNSSPVWSIDSPRKDENLLSKQLQQTIQSSAIKTSSMQFLPPQVHKIPTVQELERDLIEKNKQTNKTFVKQITNNNFNQLLNQSRNFYQNINQQQHMNVQNFNVQTQNSRSKFTQSTGSNNKYPPGFGPHQRGPFPQPPQEMVLLRNNQNMPMLLSPRLLPPYILPAPHPLLLTQNARLVAPHTMMRFMPPHPLLMQQLQQLQQQHLHISKNQQRCSQNNPDVQRSNSRNNNGNSNSNNGQGNNYSWVVNSERRGAGDFDEYAGLMSNRERQWLQNIQLIQLTADKPGICDYYYLEWSKRQEKKSKDQTKNGIKNDKKPQESFFSNNKQLQIDGRQRDRKDSELITTASPRVYVPLQFENSLGKLQCVSVTAPRKIIDLDVVSEPQTDMAPPTSHRDSRKTKKILLELERLYFWAMELEDIDNNVPLEDSHLSKPELIDKIMSGFLSEERFVNFMCIRKGKTLLLRILPKISETERKEQMSDLWCRIIKSFPVIVRRDQNDSLLMQMYPFFKKWINTVEYVTLTLICSLILSGNTQTNVKSSTRAPSPSSGKSIFSCMLSSKFGVSIIASILSQGEVIYPSLGDKEKLDWSTYVFNFLKSMTNVPNLENIPTPLDPLSSNVSTAILNRSTGLHIQDHASAKRVLNCFQLE